MIKFYLIITFLLIFLLLYFLLLFIFMLIIIMFHILCDHKIELLCNDFFSVLNKYCYNIYVYFEIFRFLFSLFFNRMLLWLLFFFLQRKKLTIQQLKNDFCLFRNVYLNTVFIFFASINSLSFPSLQYQFHIYNKNETHIKKNTSIIYFCNQKYKKFTLFIYFPFISQFISI